MKRNLKVFIKGAGEMATGVAWRLYQSHFQVLMTETREPLAVRRAVSFCEVVYEGRKTVEGVEAILVDQPEQTNEAWANARIPLLVDTHLEIMAQIKPVIS